jgi:D-lactate dehydrogenase
VFGGIMAGFGMNVLAYDPGTSAEDLLARGARYVPLAVRSCRRRITSSTNPRSAR